MNSPWDVVALRAGASMNSTPTPRAARSCTIPRTSIVDMPSRSGDLTHRCMVLPDRLRSFLAAPGPRMSQCTYRCVVLPDSAASSRWRPSTGLNAPTGAWCSLTGSHHPYDVQRTRLNAPTGAWCSLTRFLPTATPASSCLNAPTGAWCSLTGGWYAQKGLRARLNAPTGAWCSLTFAIVAPWATIEASQCTYRCVVLPDTLRVAYLS